MGKDSKKIKKKGHGADKTAAKTERKAARKAKKDARIAGEEDIDAVVAQLEAEESAKHRPLVELTDSGQDGFRPSPRSGFSWTANPRGQEIYLFGGEQRLPGGRLRVLNEHLVYSPAGNRWVQLGSGTLPTPRCAHQAALGKPTNQSAQLFVFGGEYATPTESQFRHYDDLWSWTVKSRQWRKVAPTAGPSPCARSGHRMAALRRPRLRLLLFGGFQDNGRAFRYLNDLWSYDCDAAAWTEIRTAGAGPSPRSACLLFPLPDDSGLCLIGGYSKKTEKRSEKGVVHTDCYTISLATGKASAESPEPQAAASSAAAAAPTWPSIKFSGQRPTPRCGVSGGVNPSTGRAYAFGGVFDIEQADDAMTGVMFNELYQLDLAKQRWRLVELGGCGGAAEVGASAAAAAAVSAAATSAPCERINCGLTVMDDLLYLYGGIYEGEDDEDVGGAGDGEKTRTLDDLHCLNLKRLDTGWTTLMPATDLGGDDFSLGDNEDNEGEEDNNENDDDDNSSTASSDHADAKRANAGAASADTGGPPAIAAGETADAYAERTGGYWSRAVGDSLKRCWSPEEITEALVAKYARRAAKDFYWQADS